MLRRGRAKALNNQLSSLYRLNSENERLTKKLFDLKLEQAESLFKDGETNKQQDLEEIIQVVCKQKELLIKNYLYELRRCYKYLNTISDNRVRLILTLRHIHFLSWSQVETCVGGGLTGNKAKELHDNFLAETVRAHENLV